MIEHEDGQSNMSFMESLRSLQEHFVRDDEPYSFSEYRRRLSSIYSGLKANLII